MPPIGAACEPQAAAKPSLTFTVPVRSRAATSGPRRADHTLAFSPYALSLARATASSSEATRYTASTGPKVSSRHSSMSSVTPVSTVGS